MVTGQTYRVGGTLYPVTPDVPTGLCDMCGDRLKARPDGTVVMHTREPLPGELLGVHWCDGGLPACIRHTT